MEVVGTPEELQGRRIGSMNALWVSNTLAGKVT
jgi:hypothetical protein